MASLRKLLSDSMVYGLSSIIGRFLNYLLVPIYTYHIAASSGGYGVVTNIYAHVALLLVILTFGMETTYFYFANKNEEEDEKKVFGTALGAVGLVGVLFIALVLIFIGPISGWLGYSNHPEYIRAMAIVVALDAFQAILFARLRFENRAWKFAALKLGFIVASIILTLFVFLVAPQIQNLGWMSWYNGADQVKYIFYINLICTALVTLGFIPELKKLTGGRIFDTTLLKQMLIYTWPLLLLGIAGIMNQVADKQLYPYLVPGEEGRVQLGIYGACAKIAMIMAMITQAFRYAYEPFVFAGSRDSKSKESQALVMKYFIMFTLLAFLAVMSYLDLLKYIIEEEYWEGLRVVPIVMMAEILMGIYFNLSFWYKLIGKTYWGAIMSAIGCVVLIGVNIVFVPKYGYIACAWGGVAGYGVCVLLSYFIGQHYSPTKFPLKAIAACFVATIALMMLMTLGKEWPLGWRLVYNTLLLLVYMVMVIYNERAMVMPMMTKVIKKIIKK